MCYWNPCQIPFCSSQSATESALVTGSADVFLSFGVNLVETIFSGDFTFTEALKQFSCCVFFLAKHSLNKKYTHTQKGVVCWGHFFFSFTTLLKVSRSLRKNTPQAQSVRRDIPKVYYPAMFTRLWNALFAICAIIQELTMQEFNGSVRDINPRLGRLDFPFFVGRNKNKGNNKGHAPDARLRR